jgi:poly(hydroxyalkanoate) depolymerase family esterase
MLRTAGALVTTLVALGAAPLAEAATLQQVNGWGISGLPSDVTMHVYVPDNVAAKPPVLAVIHYCGGTAAAVLGQAQGIARAADQYGFIMVLPSSGRCWDVVSNKTRTRDGLGDSHAIRQMVKYAIDTHSGNAERVYATGDSSGGMMTELLLALYPDVFKGGSAFAGMPAWRRGTNES